MQRKHASGPWPALFSAWVGVLAGGCEELPPGPDRHCDEGSVCRDSDCDFICDLEEGVEDRRDTDGDGTPDYLDSDSDNDGLSDRDEAGDEDRRTAPVDRDRNGIADYLDPEYPLRYQPRGHDAGLDAAVAEPDAGLDAGASPRESPEHCADCSGCSDQLQDCSPSLRCPDAAPDAQPFVPYLLDARQFYAGPEAQSYRFAIGGSPCDRMFQRIDPSADAESGKQSYVLRQLNATQAELLFTLSGSYPVELSVITRDGAELRCSFVVHVRAPGLRVELCWDKTGPSAHQAGDAVDLDLHLAKHTATEQFETPSDCYWQTCRGESGLWGYPNTPSLDTCTGTAAQNFQTYSALGFCPNPRLDADNRLDARSRATYITETINLDLPKPGDRFRIAVSYKANVLSDLHNDDAGSATSIETRAWVNVYCEGDLLGTFGGDPERQLDPDAIQLSAPGMLWRVADVAVANAGCEISALRDPLTQQGYWVTSHDFSYGAP